MLPSDVCCLLGALEVVNAFAVAVAVALLVIANAAAAAFAAAALAAVHDALLSLFAVCLPVLFGVFVLGNLLSNCCCCDCCCCCCCCCCCFTLSLQGFVAVRFNAAAFGDGLDGPLGRTLFQKAGELAMPVGIMCFAGLASQAHAIEALLESSPGTAVVIDHWGLPRQPPTGGLLGNAAADDEVWHRE